MFSHILVPLDGSQLAECVFPHVTALATACGSRTTLLRVVERADSGQPVDLVEWHIAKAEAEEYIDGVAASFQASGVSVQKAVVEGDASEAIREFALGNGVDLVLLSSHGRTGLTGWNISSVVQKVILRTPTSSMIVRAYQPIFAGEQRVAYRRLMIPLDGSQRAECVLPLVSSLARSHDSTVLLSHVARRPEVPRRAPPDQEDLELVERMTKRNCEEGEKYLEKVKTQLPLRVESRLLVGDNVIKCLQQLTVEQQPDLVIVSAHGYSGESQWPYGSTTMSFIVYGTSPLLIVQDLAERAGAPTLAERAAEEMQGAVGGLRGPTATA